MSRMDSSLMKASALRFEVSVLGQSAAGLSQAMVRSTTQRLGWTIAKPVHPSGSLDDLGPRSGRMPYQGAVKDRSGT